MVPGDQGLPDPSLLLVAGHERPPCFGCPLLSKGFAGQQELLALNSFLFPGAVAFAWQGRGDTELVHAQALGVHPLVPASACAELTGGTDPIYIWCCLAACSRHMIGSSGCLSEHLLDL